MHVLAHAFTHDHFNFLPVNCNSLSVLMLQPYLACVVFAAPCNPKVPLFMYILCYKFNNLCFRN